jgi:Adenylate and Guanylate cyclase catalytic domain.
MVVGGLPTPSDDHADSIAEMALDIVAAMTKMRTKGGEPLSIRHRHPHRPGGSWGNRY